MGGVRCERVGDRGRRWEGERKTETETQREMKRKKERETDRWRGVSGYLSPSGVSLSRANFVSLFGVAPFPFHRMGGGVTVLPSPAVLRKLGHPLRAELPQEAVEGGLDPVPTAHSASSVASCLNSPTLPLLGAEAQGLARPLLPPPTPGHPSGQWTVGSQGLVWPS